MLAYSPYLIKDIPGDKWHTSHNLLQDNIRCRLLREELEHFESDKYGEAAYILYGLTPGTRGTTVTARMEKAAQLLNRELRTMYHVRKRIAKRLAWQILLRHGGTGTSQSSPESA